MKTITLLLITFIVLIAGFAIDWCKALNWWSGDAEPHESLRNLGLILAGFIGIGLAAWRSVVASIQARTAQQGQITDRFSKAVEHLGSDNVSVRIGGIYALKRIAQDSMERDHISVMEVLTNFIRHSPYAEQQRTASGLKNKYDNYRERAQSDMEYARDTEPPLYPRFLDCPDLIAAIETIRTRSDVQKAFETNYNFYPSLKKADFSYLLLNDVDLSDLNLDGINLKNANVTGINLSNNNLSGYDLQDLDLSSAILSGIDLSDSDLSRSILAGVTLDNATLERTNISRVNFQDAILKDANLTGANLFHADLTNADLTNVNLTNANLEGAILTHADLSNTNFAGANLNGTNIWRHMIRYHDFIQEPENAEITQEDFYQFLEAPDLSNSFTRPGQLPRNLPEGISPPPERE